MNDYKKYILFVISIITACLWCAGCEKKTQNDSTPSDRLAGDLVIYHAGSLAVPFKKVSEAFMAEHPSVRVIREVAGSRECARKVCDLGKQCDVLASADGKVIGNLLMPKYADWYIEFATNEMVLVYRDEVQEGLTLETLPQRLLQTESLGRADPDLDPCGYRTLMVWQLLERYYEIDGFYQALLKVCPKEKTRPKETDLLALLESGLLDYFFIYRSVARQHGLKYLELPPGVNLSDPTQAQRYARAVVEVTGKTIGSKITRKGEPIVYGITVPTNARCPELGNAFIQFLVSPKGSAIMESAGHGVLHNAVPADSADAKNILMAVQSHPKDSSE